MLLIVTAVALLVRTIAARHRAVIITSAIGLVAIIAAAGSGVSFLKSAMAMAVAFLCYTLGLFLLGQGSRRP